MKNYKTKNGCYFPCFPWVSKVEPGDCIIYCCVLNFKLVLIIYLEIFLLSLYIQDKLDIPELMHVVIDCTALCAPAEGPHYC